MDPEELESQEDHKFAIRVGLKKNMRRTVVNAVGHAYQDKYLNRTNPCRVTTVNLNHILESRLITNKQKM